MRRMITSKLVAWVKSLVNHVAQNGNTTEIGGNLEVDGDFKVNGKVDGELSFRNHIDFEQGLSIPSWNTLTDEDGNHIGQDMADAVSGNNEMTITITEDDWDEDENSYVKRVNINNTFFVFDTTQCNPTSHDLDNVSVLLYCPYFKGCLPINNISFYCDTFSGIVSNPEDRYALILQTSSTYSIFNGIFTPLLSQI